MATRAPYKLADRWTIDKDPEEKSYYAADITAELADRATTAASVQAVIEGVTLLEGPALQTKVVAGVTRTYVVVKIGGWTDATNKNLWTARVTCANTEEFDKTTWFNRVDT